MERNKIIFTFWEPQRNIPAYLNLCLRTWKKFLPEYEIVVLDYSNLNKWLEEDNYDKFLYSKRFSYALQADAIRCAVLKKYGGIWLDVDTIITSSNVKEVFNINADFILAGKHLGMIIANKDCYVLNSWKNQIIKKINYCKNIYHNKFVYITMRVFCRNKWKEIRKWNYLGNSIIDSLLSNENGCCSLDKKSLYILPEINYAEERCIQLTTHKEHCANYRSFYFDNNYVNYILENNKCGIIELHNSRTPKELINMTEEEFLSQNNTMAELFRKLLY